jgi:cytochrome oxidase Cu insertion factor (SCO1/SenC/PrrC family)
MYRLIKHRKRLLALGLLVSGLFATARVSSALDVGAKAPEFTLPATTGEKISLKQFRGKKIVLLEFYGADYSPV